LSNRVDAAFVVRGGAERSSVIKVTAAVPVPVPTVSLESRLHIDGMCPPARRARQLAAPLREQREFAQRRVEEPAEPDTFALPAGTDPTHAVIPVARADQRQSVHSDGQTLLERTDAVLEE